MWRISQRSCRIGKVGIGSPPPRRRATSCSSDCRTQHAENDRLRRCDWTKYHPYSRRTGDEERGCSPFRYPSDVVGNGWKASQRSNRLRFKLWSSDWDSSQGCSSRYYWPSRSLVQSIRWRRLGLCSDCGGRSFPHRNGKQPNTPTDSKGNGPQDNTRCFRLRRQSQKIQWRGR